MLFEYLEGVLGPDQIDWGHPPLNRSLFENPQSGPSLEFTIHVLTVSVAGTY